jgi:hemerythrin-like metal-binding protein
VSTRRVIPLSPIVWLPGFAIEQESVDGQHRKLMSDINSLTNMLFERRTWSSIVAMAVVLRKDSIEHFETEEEFLTTTGYPGLSKHRGEHRDMTRRLDDIVQHLAGVHQASRTDIEAALHMRSMLLDHFFRKDFAYKLHVAAARRHEEHAR